MHVKAWLRLIATYPKPLWKRIQGMGNSLEVMLGANTVTGTLQMPEDAHRGAVSGSDRTELRTSGASSNFGWRALQGDPVTHTVDKANRNHMWVENESKLSARIDYPSG